MTNEKNSVFGSSVQAASYHNSPFTFMPGYEDVQRMAMVLLREKVSDQVRILVHGAGTGAEMAFFAEHNSDWQLHGIDPSSAMLVQAQQNLQSFAPRTKLQCGYIDEVDAFDFVGATSLLTMHFLEPEQRLHNLQSIVRRLVPGAPLIVVHCSATENEIERQKVFDQHASFRRSHGVAEALVAQGREDLENLLHILSPEQDMALMKKAGLNHVSEFYSAFTWRGWVGYV